MNISEVTLRPAADADYAFMRNLYAATRAEEMERFPFDEARKRVFLDQQFAAQFEHYGIHYPTCERNIIEKDGALIGRLWIDEWRDQIRIAAGKPVTIHVEAFNPALRLYQRLAFEQVDTNGVYYVMRRAPRLEHFDFRPDPAVCSIMSA